MATETPPFESAPPSDVDLPTKLNSLLASATQQYSLKNYSAAAEFFSEAAEIQDEINGEMNVENADLLYQYGRCLYHVAVAKSDVLGGKVAGESEPKRKKRKVSQHSNGEGSSSGTTGIISDTLKSSDEKLAEDVVEAVVEEKDDIKTEKKDDVSSKPFFQITGDENFTDSEDEEDNNDGDEEKQDEQAEEEEDDFATAFEILDVARVLLGRKLERISAEDPEAKESGEQRLLKERLADTHDLQAEISLENERFHDAIKDTRDALSLKLDLYPPESSLIAEAHFKLSLALEFASVTAASSQENKTDAAESQPAQVDEKMRAEAASEMELAIKSCELRIAKEESHLSTLAPDSIKHAEQQRSIADVKEMVADMRQRLLDLKNPAVSLSGPTGPAGAPGVDDDPVRGILGEMLGESKAEQKKRIQEATEGANDLSRLVKRKKVKVEDGEKNVVVGNGKRKVDEVEANGGDAGGKKVKFEE